MEGTLRKPWNIVNIAPLLLNRWSTRKVWAELQVVSGERARAYFYGLVYLAFAMDTLVGILACLRK